METSFEHRSGFLTPDDGFDPLSEIKRLRQDLMLRLQRLQQSVVTEADDASAVRVSSVKSATVEQIVSPQSDSAKDDVRGPSESVLYISPIFRTSGEIPMTTETPVVRVPLSVLERTAPTVHDGLEEAVLGQTVVEVSSFSGELRRDDSEDSGFVRILGWINLVLVCIGGVGAVAGIYHFILRKQFGNTQGIAMMLLIAGIAMVLIGVVGRWLYRNAGRLVLTN